MLCLQKTRRSQAAVASYCYQIILYHSLKVAASQTNHLRVAVAAAFDQIYLYQNLAAAVGIDRTSLCQNLAAVVVWIGRTSLYQNLAAVVGIDRTSLCQNLAAVVGIDQTSLCQNLAAAVDSYHQTFHHWREYQWQRGL